jgi:ubiquinone/menaquinone biosynthesis C-methylase UbiE
MERTVSMSLPHSSNAPSNSYIINAGNPAEIMRLVLQGRLLDQILTRGQGGVLAELHGHSIHHILDIACGPGEWALEAAQAYPTMEVIGIDISQQMIDYASEQASTRKLPNVQFQIMDATKALLFPDGSFDLVNARFISTFMPNKEAWSKLVSESRRLLKPGGVLRMTEFERGLSNSPIHEHISSVYTQTLHSMERTFSPDGLHLGIIPMLGAFLKDAEFERIQYKMFGVDYSSGEEAHDAWIQNFLLAFRLSFPFIERAKKATIEELEKMYQKAMIEMDLPEFRAILSCLSVWGYKPVPHQGS